MIDLDMEMRQVLGELELISHGSVSSLNSSGGGDLGSVILSSDGIAPHTYWRDRYEKADHDAHRERAIFGARTELAAWRGYGRETPRNLPSDGEILIERILECEGWPLKDVAATLRCTETKVRKVRVDDGRAPNDGKPLTVTVDNVDLVTRVRDLASRDLTQKQIATIAGTNQTAVHRILKGAT